MSNVAILHLLQSLTSPQGEARATTATTDPLSLLQSTATLLDSPVTKYKHTSYQNINISHYTMVHHDLIVY